jgi:uncharacterized membrane protein
MSRIKETVETLARKNIKTIASLDRIANTERTHGDKVADAFARTVGSWKFIIIQSILLLGWVALNITAYIQHWDPYPFILLNLALSFQAAYASPIIMMSQNRQAKLAERRNQLDLQINLLAEQESTETLRLVRAICKKLDLKVTDEAHERGLEQETKPDRIFAEIQQEENEERAEKILE